MIIPICVPIFGESFLFKSLSGKVEFDQAVIIPIITEIKNPRIVGPSKNDGMSGLGKDGCWLDLLRTFGRTDLLLNRGGVRWQWQLVR